MKKRKGLSIVVTSLILILLVLVAIGLIWLVVRNIVEEGSGQVDIGTKCLKIDVRATAVGCFDRDPSTDVCNVTLTRKAGGDEIGGVKLVFKDDEGNSGDIEDVSGDIESLTTKFVEDANADLAFPASVDVTVYLLDESGEELLCSQTNKFSF